MMNRIVIALFAIVVGLLLAWGMWVFQANQKQLEKRPATKICSIRIVLDATYTGSKDCWVIEECGDGDSFESLFRGKEMQECIDYQDDL